MTNLPPLWDVDWQQQAACRGCDPDIWFPTRGKDVHQAKTICAECPVIGQCRSWAIFYGERQGVWGGLTGNERRRARRGIPERYCPECGMNHVSWNPDQALCPWCRRWQPKLLRKAI